MSELNAWYPVLDNQAEVKSQNTFGLTPGNLGDPGNDYDRLDSGREAGPAVLAAGRLAVLALAPSAVLLARAFLRPLGTTGFQPARRSLAGIASPACVRRTLGGTARTLHAFGGMGTTRRTAVVHAMGRTGSLGTLLHFPLHALAIMVHAHPFHIPSHALAVLFEFNPLQFKVKFFKLELKVHALDFQVHLLKLILTMIVVVVVMAVSVVTVSVMAVSVVLVVMTIPIVMVSVMTAIVVLVMMTTSVMVTFTSLAAQGPSIWPWLPSP